MLKEQLPQMYGLQPPVLDDNFAISPAPNDHFGQVNDGHRLALSTVGCRPSTICVFDSLNLRRTTPTETDEAGRRLIAA